MTGSGGAVLVEKSWGGMALRSTPGPPLGSLVASEGHLPRRGGIWVWGQLHKSAVSVYAHFLNCNFRMGQIRNSPLHPYALEPKQILYCFPIGNTRELLFEHKAL